MKGFRSVITILAAIFCRQGYGDVEEHRLYADLFDENKTFTVPPTNSASGPMQFEVGFALHRIVDLNEKTQTLHSSVWLRLKWMDERLKWDPQEYSNVTTLVTTYPIWMPDIALYNDVRDADRLLSMYSKIIDSDGSVVWLAPVVYLSLCRLESFYFPFDEQNCEFNFRSSSYNDLELEYVNMGAAGDMSAYASNGEWDIVAIPVSTNRTCCASNPAVTYTAVLQRRGTYYMIALILPLFFMVLLTTSSFYLPVESGEKALLSVIVFLSHMVYTLVVVALLPPSSGKIPLIGHYLLMVQILTAMSTILNVSVIHIHYRGEHSRIMPMWAKRLVHHSIRPRAKVAPLKKRKPKEEKMEVTRKVLLYGMNAVRNAFVVDGGAAEGLSQTLTGPSLLDDRLDVTDTFDYRRLQRSILSCVTHMNMEATESAAQQTTRFDWARLAMVCDRVCRYCYLFISAVVIIIIATRVLNAPHVQWGKYIPRL